MPFPDLQERCSQCDKNTRNKYSYFADPCNCSYYYQCEWSDPLSQYKTHHLSCPSCTCFSNIWLTCAFAGYTSASCSNKEFGESSCTQAGALYSPVLGDPTRYQVNIYGTTLTMRCASGTIFDARKCGCILGTNPIRKSGWRCIESI